MNTVITVNGQKYVREDVWGKAVRERQQAIDALREIAREGMTPYANAAPVARAALLSLGEQPPPDQWANAR